MTASIDVSETTPADGEPELVDGPVRNTWSRRWKPTLTEAGIALILGLAALLIFRWRSGIGALDTSSPILYQADMFVFGNDVFNGQLGDLFLGHTLGGSQGQQMGLSAYGIEYVQWWIAGHLASGDNGPWLAIARYWQLSYIVAGATAYLALRWISVRRSAAVIGALAFTLMENHQRLFASLDLVSIGVLPLVLALSFRLVSGSSFSELVPSSWGLAGRHRHWCGLILVALVTLFALTGAHYYMVFNLCILASSAAIMLVRRRWWVRARRLGMAAALALVPLAIAYAPVVTGRLSAGLALSEDATTDRRPFAAYANGGDPFGLLVPNQSGFILTTLNKIPLFGGFFQEYNFDNATHEYGQFMAGILVVSALLIIGLAILGAYRRKDFLQRPAPLPAIVKAVCAVGLLTILWFTRGAIGTFVAFVVPQIRGYARVGPMVVFCAIALLGLAATAGLLFPKKIRILALVLLSVGMIESVTATTPQTQVDPRAVALSYPITRNEIDMPTGGFGLSVKIPGPQGTKDLLAAADRSLAAGCTVLVMPLVKYPVDFNIGVVSYRAYDTVLPGLMPSNLHWTSGGFTGTPNNAFVDKWLGPYRHGDITELLQAADEAGFCGTLFFDTMHEAFYKAGVLNGSKYETPSSDVTVALRQHYGEPCYAPIDAGIELYCRKGMQPK